MIESHWIPADRNLWKIENYLNFLSARRELLSNAANKFLDSLFVGDIPEKELVILGSVESEEELQLLVECNDWIVSHGLPDGELEYELCDPISGDSLAILDLAWPNELQEGLSEPVTLLIDEGKEIEGIVNRAGYRYFTNVSDFKEYVKKILVLENETF